MHEHGNISGHNQYPLLWEMPSTLFHSDKPNKDVHQSWRAPQSDAINFTRKKSTSVLDLFEGV